MSMKIDRRRFIANTSLSATGILLAGKISGCASSQETQIVSYDIMKDVMKYRKIDAHQHPSDDLEKQIEIADRLGIEKIITCSKFPNSFLLVRVA